MVESQIVILAVAGSNPVGHPNLSSGNAGRHALVMNRMLRRSLFAAVLPVVVFVAGAALMILASGHRAVERRLDRVC